MSHKKSKIDAGSQGIYLHSVCFQIWDFWGKLGANDVKYNANQHALQISSMIQYNNKEPQYGSTGA